MYTQSVVFACVMLAIATFTRYLLSVISRFYIGLGAGHLGGGEFLGILVRGVPPDSPNLTLYFRPKHAIFHTRFQTFVVAYN